MLIFLAHVVTLLLLGLRWGIPVATFVWVLANTRSIREVHTLFCSTVTHSKFLCHFLYEFCKNYFDSTLQLNLNETGIFYFIQYTSKTDAQVCVKNYNSDANNKDVITVDYIVTGGRRKDWIYRDNNHIFKVLFSLSPYRSAMLFIASLFIKACKARHLESRNVVYCPAVMWFHLHEETLPGIFKSISRYLHSPSTILFLVTLFNKPANPNWEGRRYTKKNHRRRIKLYFNSVTDFPAAMLFNVVYKTCNQTHTVWEVKKNGLIP